jgi:hypothetical protein
LLNVCEKKKRVWRAFSCNGSEKFESQNERDEILISFLL